MLFALTMSPVRATPLQQNGHNSLHQHVGPRADTSRLVFAHIIVGLLANRNGPGDWDADMKRAKDVGIDAFALNIGTDDYTEKQLNYAYESAGRNGIKCFISFDFNWWPNNNAQGIGKLIAQYISHPAQLKVDGKTFVSTFVGDGLDVSAVRAASGGELYFAPNFRPSPSTNLASVDCAFNWMGWPNNGNNRAPAAGQTGTVESGDRAYLSALGGKDYMAPVSPWFFTHYGKEVSYSKNWIFPGDTLWYDRWNTLLKTKPRFVEIVSWNDYGESHYVGPLSSPHIDDGASKWVNDMPHDGWLDMAKPFIAAYKAGAPSIDDYIEGDQLVYWYRPQPKTVNCDATDTCMTPPEGGNYYLGRPNGWDTSSDSVFVVSLLKSSGTLEVSSGGSKYSFQVPAGASIQTVPMAIGKQAFSLSRNGQTVLSGTSAKEIMDGCVCGIYNFNAYVGTLPERPTSALASSGLSNFMNGLKVSTCAATPSLSSIKSTSTQASTETTRTTIKSVQSSTTSTSKSSTSVKATTTDTSVKTGSSKATVVPTSTTSVLVSSTCNAGTGAGNYAGLCAFSCSYGYCPPGPCTCTAYGSTATEPSRTGTRCVPAEGLDESYSGLCTFSCDRGYVPSGACKVV